MDEKLQELERQLEAERRVNASFTELSKAIISPVLSRNDIYQMVLDQARALTSSDHGFVSSIDPISGAHVSHTLTKMKADGCAAPLTEGVLPRGPHKKYSSLWGYGLNTKEAFFTNDPSSHPASKGLPNGHVPMKNFISVPVVFHGSLLGQIALANSTHDYSQSDIDIISKLAVFYAVVLQNHLWGKALQEANDNLENKVKELTQAEHKMRHSATIQSVLREIAVAAMLTTSLAEFYQTVHILVGKVLPAKFFYITIVDETTGDLLIPFHADETFIPERRSISKGITEYIMRQGRTVHITPAEMIQLSEMGGMDEYCLGNERNIQSRHVLGAPLIESHGKPFGTMSLILVDEIQVFQPEDSEVLSIIAAQVSMAVERKRMEEELLIQATVDGLTGIYNRRHFLVRAEEELQRIDRYNGRCSLLMLDIDHFKMVNDRFGHAVGDSALLKIAGLCAESKRSTDLLGRIGGEEFAMVLIETDLAKAQQFAERLRQNIQDCNFCTEQGVPVPLRVSIGVAERKPNNEKLAALMARADEALYFAKNKGRNMVVKAE